MSQPQHQTLLILDFGAQYTQLIARRVREAHVYCEVLRHDTPAAEITKRNPAGLIFSGGPSSVYDNDAPLPDPALYELGVPILGICYGQQAMAFQLGGGVEPATNREYGGAELTITKVGTIFERFAHEGEHLNCWMSHGDKVLTPPPGFEVYAVTDSTPIAAMGNPEKGFYGVQFHPEVVHTPFGRDLIESFLKDVCGCVGDWTTANFIEEATQKIRETVGGAHVICGVSGGVDSCCVAALMHRAIGDQLTCIFVDHGLLRKGEAEQVRFDFAEALGINLIYADAKEQFLSALKGVSDPEQKRKVIGREFVNVFQKHAAQIENAEFLAQGTLYPDVIESGGSHKAHTIKTHHNVGGLPEDMKLKVIEPLRMLFKDEVRAVSEGLGLPEPMVWRHPFPGPGLGIRILGEVSEEKLTALREADAIFMEELRRFGLYREVQQALTVLIPIRNVGVMGDQRTYAYPVALRAVTTDDFMTAHWARLPYDLLERVSARIVNEVPNVNRVVYDISSKPPATIEWE